jgi:hypothetical protein
VPTDTAFGIGDAIPNDAVSIRPVDAESETPASTFPRAFTGGPGDASARPGWTAFVYVILVEVAAGITVCSTVCRVQTVFEASTGLSVVEPTMVEIDVSAVRVNGAVIE